MHARPPGASNEFRNRPLSRPPEPSGGVDYGALGATRVNERESSNLGNPAFASGQTAWTTDAAPSADGYAAPDYVAAAPFTYGSATATTAPPQLDPYSPGQTPAHGGQQLTNQHSPQGFDQAFSVVGFALRHWQYLAFAIACASVVAYLTAGMMSSLRYNFDAQLLYNRLSAQSVGYETPSLTALTPLVNSRSVLDNVRESLELDLGLDELNGAIEVEVPFESNLLDISMTWHDENEGAEILNEVVQQFLLVVARSRKAAVSDSLSNIENVTRELDSDVAVVREQIAAFNQRLGVVDLDRDLTALQVEVDKLVQALDKAERANEARRAQIAALDADPTDPATGQTRSALKVTNDVERWRMLKDVVTEEERRIKQQADLEFQEKEYERAKELHARRYISDSEYEAIKTKYEALAALNDPTLARLRGELAGLESKVPTAVRAGAATSAAGGTSASVRTTLELGLIAGDIDIKHLSEELAEKEQRRTTLLGAKNEGQRLKEQLKAATTEKDRLAKREKELRNYVTDEPIEFTTLSTADAAMTPTTSNRKKLLVMAFVGTMLLLAGPLLVKEFAASQPTAQQPATS